MKLKRKWNIEVIADSIGGITIQNTLTGKMIRFVDAKFAMAALTHIMTGDTMEDWDCLLEMPLCSKEYCENHNLSMLTDKEIKTLINNQPK